MVALLPMSSWGACDDRPVVVEDKHRPRHLEPADVGLSVAKESMCAPAVARNPAKQYCKSPGFNRPPCPRMSMMLEGSTRNLSVGLGFLREAATTDNSACTAMFITTWPNKGGNSMEAQVSRSNTGTATFVAPSAKPNVRNHPASAQRTISPTSASPAATWITKSAALLSLWGVGRRRPHIVGLHELHRHKRARKAVVLMQGYGRKFAEAPSDASSRSAAPACTDQMTCCAPSKPTEHITDLQTLSPSQATC